MLDPHDTIAAIASPPGGAARGIIRLSGPQTIDCLKVAWQPEQGMAALTELRAPVTLDGALACESLTAAVPCSLYVWPTTHSYTRQPSVEIHTVGSPPVLQALLGMLCHAGARVAAPGEFTLRAFLAGRLDLVQAEAVLGVIDASDRDGLDAALAQLAGGIGGRIHELRDTLLDLLADLEAGLDFVEEQIEFISRDELLEQLTVGAATVDALATQVTGRGLARDAARAVLAGRPNVGKSSLFNALVEHEAALVSPTAGTTRDYLVARLVIDDVDIDLIDTAGTGEQTADTKDGAAAKHIAAAAERAAEAERERADIELFCCDASRPLSAEERAALTRSVAQPRVIVLLKSDLPRLIDLMPGAVEVSSLTGAGLAHLRERLRTAALECRTGVGDLVAVTAVRCGDSLRAAADALRQAKQLAVDRTGDELVASELRAAIDAVGQVVGAVYTDDILDRIFSRFCIGK